MDITFNCEKCGQPLTIDESGAGQLIDCPKCGIPVEVPQKPKPLVPANTPLPHPLPSRATDKKCPVCAETSKADAKVCRFCDYNFVTRQRGASLSTGTASPRPKILIVLVVVATLVGGGVFWKYQQAARAEAARAKAVASDPVADLKETMKLFDRARVEADVKPVASDYSFNVEKTDSLVSPIVGTVVYFLDVKVNASFAYQNGRWVVKRVCATLPSVASMPERSYCDEGSMGITVGRVSNTQPHWRGSSSSSSDYYS